MNTKPGPGLSMKHHHIFQYFIALLFVLTFGIGTGAATAQEKGKSMTDKENAAIGYFAGGCFWCVESEFGRLPGVTATRVGYSGGDLENPTYQQVSTGKTGHAETVEVTYDPRETDYRTLVDFFLTKAHDPTEINRQGVDVGPQYRSAIFYQNTEQKKIAEEEIARLNAGKAFAKPIATEVTPFRAFWQAEEYHQKYYDKYEAKTGKPHPGAFRHLK